MGEIALGLFSILLVLIGFAAALIILIIDIMLLECAFKYFNNFKLIAMSQIMTSGKVYKKENIEGEIVE